MSGLGTFSPRLLTPTSIQPLPVGLFHHPQSNTNGILSLGSVGHSVFATNLMPPITPFSPVALSSNVVGSLSNPVLSGNNSLQPPSLNRTSNPNHSSANGQRQSNSSSSMFPLAPIAASTQSSQQISFSTNRQRTYSEYAEESTIQDSHKRPRLDERQPHSNSHGDDPPFHPLFCNGATSSTAPMFTFSSASQPLARPVPPPPPILPVPPSPLLPTSSSSSSTLPSSFGRSRRPPGARTDKDGHFIVTENDWLNEHYQIIRQLGEGTFSKVVECIDVRTRQKVAVKVIRAIRKYTESAEVELDILKRLMEKDKEDRICFIKPLSQFMVEGHMCIVFERLGPSLYDFLKENKYRGFCLRDITEIALSALTCIEFFHKLRLIHTDLKPENILLVSGEYIEEVNRNFRLPKSTHIRIIDFGSSIWEYQPHAELIQTRHYRAPEVVLGLGWSFPADMWSIGCILVELLTGEALFQTHDSREHICMMAKVFGGFPRWMGIEADQKSRKWFKADGTLIPLDPDSDGGKFIAKMKTLKDLIGHFPDFYDLVSKLLNYDPRKRLTPAQALHHPFFT